MEGIRQRLEAAQSIEEVFRLVKEWKPDGSLPILKTALSRVLEQNAPRANVLRTTPFEMVPAVITAEILSYGTAAEVLRNTAVSKDMAKAGEVAHGKVMSTMDFEEVRPGRIEWHGSKGFVTKRASARRWREFEGRDVRLEEGLLWKGSERS